MSNIRKPKRGRPPGTTGRAAVLSPNQIRHAFRVARARGRHAARAEAVLAMSIGLGLRAKELAGLRWVDLYDEAGKVRPVVHLKAAYTKGGKTRDVFISSPALRRVLEGYGERDWLGSARASQASLFASQKGGPMTAGSMARFLRALYAEAGIAGATSHSGWRTLITRLAERGIDLKAIAEIAGHTSIRTTTMYIESNPKRLARILQDVTFWITECLLLRPLLGAKQTWVVAPHMSAFDPKRTSQVTLTRPLHMIVGQEPFLV